ncbi:MAG: hypothetical protein K8T91_14000 [Planctomycetes bacterium]|nr:hypothetical protein [Planctomycetota bacterium]
MVFTSLFFLTSVTPLFAALDGGQKQTLATAENGLKQIEANLKLAQGAAGAGTAAIQGSRSRLVQSRLVMAKGPLAQVTELLATLPADDAQVAAVKQRLDAVTAGVAAIEARLGAAPATAPVPAPSTNPAANPPAAAPSSEVRLDYKQEQLAKDARSYLAEIEGLAGGAADVVKKITPIQDQLTIDHRLVQSAANSIAKGRQRAGLVQGRLEQLPKNGQGVAALITQLTEATASLDASDKIIAPLYKKLSALVDPGSYPALEADIKRVQELAGMYRDPQVLTSNCERAAALVSQAPAAQAEALRFAKAYAPLVQQQTPAGERVQKMGQFFQENYAAFSAAAAQRKLALPAEIAADLAKANRMAEQAIAEQKPAFFGGGIPQIVAFAEEKLILLTALDPAGATAMKAKVSAAKQQLKAREASLKDAIITTNELPPDRYAGSDKAALTQLAIATWKKTQPTAEILAIRFPSQQWNRETLLRWENRAWHPIDRSRLQAQLIVKQDAKQAVIRPINLSTNHLNNNQVTAMPMDGVADELPPQRYLLIDKVK